MQVNKTLTTKDVIKLIPFGEELKTMLLNNFDHFNADQKFLVEDVAWNTYYALYKLKKEENLQLALLRAQNNQEKLDADFYDRVEAQTEEQMQTEALDTVQKVDLDQARKAMEQIVQEIRASKVTKKK